MRIAASGILLLLASCSSFQAPQGGGAGPIDPHKTPPPASQPANTSSDVLQGLAVAQIKTMVALDKLVDAQITVKGAEVTVQQLAPYGVIVLLLGVMLAAFRLTRRVITQTEFVNQLSHDREMKRLARRGCHDNSGKGKPMSVNRQSAGGTSRPR